MPSRASNTLIILFPTSILASPTLSASFKAHFAGYGALRHWAYLCSAQRVIAVYETEDDARAAKEEMDGFVWGSEGETPDENGQKGDLDTPIRLYYAPHFSESSFLAPPTLDKNFLISPPGSPPVGWEQVVEDAPNKVVLPEGAEEEWIGELERALRYLSTSAGDDEDEEPVQEVAVEDEEGADTTLLPPSSAGEPSRPGLVVSPAPPTGSDSPERRRRAQGGDRIENVRATVESMLPSLAFGEGEPLEMPTTRKIPTARPPLPT